MRISLSSKTILNCFGAAAFIALAATPAANAQLDAKELAEIRSSTLVLTGQTSKCIVLGEFGQVVSNVLNEALRNNKRYQALEVAMKKPHPVKKLMAKVAGVAGEIVSINATASSKEGAQIVLDEVGDWEDRDALIYQRQKLIDELHPKIAAALLQIAMGRGNPVQDARSIAIADKGYAELAALSGGDPKEVAKTVDRWMENVGRQESMEYSPSDLLRVRKNLDVLSKAALTDDPALVEIKRELRGVARPNRFKDAMCSSLQTMLDSTAYMMPSAGLAVAVEAVKGVLVTSTGGCEEDKLQHLLFLLKRIASRQAALNEEIHTAMFVREVGIHTSNKLLVECSSALIGNLISPAAVTGVLTTASNPRVDDDDDD